VLLAHLAAADLDAYLATVQLVERTTRTITSVAKLRKALAQVRDAGYAALDQELEVGLRSIAVPVRDMRSNIVAAINVSTHASRASLEEMKTRFLPTLRACAQSLQQVLVA
jgi:IclR family transcriptional regulator, pca regulon regulatory protein